MSKLKKVMISQPMKGKTGDEIKAEKAAAEEYLTGQGNEVIIAE